MSRHTIGHTKDGWRIILGYDRPLDNFFVQVWNRNGLKDKVTCSDSIDTIEVAAELGGVVPFGMEKIIFEESIGCRDTNTVKDWRTK